MPTVLRAGPYRLYFFSGDRTEPPHVHVGRDSCMAKFWLAPVRCAWSRGFNPAETRRISAMIVLHETQLKDAWREYFGT